jgi:hypothetical protein
MSDDFSPQRCSLAQSERQRGRPTSGIPMLAGLGQDRLDLIDRVRLDLVFLFQIQTRRGGETPAPLPSWKQCRSLDQSSVT